jgi:hypothetical protein
MDLTEEGFAKRCLPLLIANQHGWHILNTHRVRARWAGGNSPAEVWVESAGNEVASHFGHGILTWTIPFLFRTPPGYNLLARGPANAPKDSMTALEGVVETDWCAATFTMNWKFTRPDTEVVFEPGEPICLIVPVRRGGLAGFEPRIEAIDADDEVAKAYYLWQWSRQRFNHRLRHDANSCAPLKWQRHYFQGTSVNGARSEDHETRLDLKDFRVVPFREHRIDERSDEDMAELFDQGDLPMLHRLMEGNPELKETALLVKKINANAKYPINSLEDLTDALGGPNATVTFRGRTMTLTEIRQFVPAYYFPISGERDLVAKISDLQSHAGAPSGTPGQGGAPGEVPTTSAVATIPPEARERPKLSAQQVLEATRAEHAASGLARRPV